MQSSIAFEQLTPAAAQVILSNLPDRIRDAFTDRAAEIDYSIEAVAMVALMELSVKIHWDWIAFIFKPNVGKVQSVGL